MEYNSSLDQIVSWLGESHQFQHFGGRLFGNNLDLGWLFNGSGNRMLLVETGLVGTDCGTVTIRIGDIVDDTEDT